MDVSLVAMTENITKSFTSYAGLLDCSASKMCMIN